MAPMTPFGLMAPMTPFGLMARKASWLLWSPYGPPWPPARMFSWPHMASLPPMFSDNPFVLMAYHSLMVFHGLIALWLQWPPWSFHGTSWFPMGSLRGHGSNAFTKYITISCEKNRFIFYYQKTSFLVLAPNVFCFISMFGAGTTCIDWTFFLYQIWIQIWTLIVPVQSGQKCTFDEFFWCFFERLLIIELYYYLE